MKFFNPFITLFSRIFNLPGKLVEGVQDYTFFTHDINWLWSAGEGVLWSSTDAVQIINAPAWFWSTDQNILWNANLGMEF